MKKVLVFGALFIALMSCKKEIVEPKDCSCGKVLASEQKAVVPAYDNDGNLIGELMHNEQGYNFTTVLRNECNLDKIIVVDTESAENVGQVICSDDFNWN